jgi:hypothetical protein
MSHIYGQNSENPYIHFKAGLKDLLRTDQVRLINITGSILYGFMYILLFLIIGILLHTLFPSFTTKTSLSSMFGWILLQCFAIIILVFYSRKLIESIPGIITFFPEYLYELKRKGLVLYGIDEYKGDMTASIVLIGTQYKLLEKIAFFTKKISQLYF